MISIPLFPLSTVLFPDGVLSLQVFEVRYLDMVQRCIKSDGMFGVVLLTEGSEVRKPGQHERLADVGTLASVRSSNAVAPGLLQVSCKGSQRFRIESSSQLKNGLWMAQATLMENDREVDIPPELQNTADALGHLIASLQANQVPDSEMPLAPPYRLDECGWVANRWCELLPIAAAQKQRLLALDNPLVRLELVQDILSGQGLLG